MMKILLLVILPIIGHGMLISSPFDNFRIECPQNSGTQRLSIKMVESQGMKRQDTVFALSCNRIDEIYPWLDIPQGVLDLEREDCHYTSMFDPIMDTNMNYTCGPREYLAGITRVTDTRIQTMCCRLRTRDEANCENVRFGKPLGFDGKVEIQFKGKLINAFTVQKNLYVVRFCDLKPRAIESILSDIRTTTSRPVTTTKATPITISTRLTTRQPTITTTTIDEKLEKEEVKEPALPMASKSFENEIEDILGAEEQTSKDANQELEILQPSTTVIASTSPETTTIVVASEKSFEEQVLSPSALRNSSSLEVQHTPVFQKTITDKDYENIEEAEAELMSTIAEMLKARKIAKNIIDKVRTAGVKQQVIEKQEKMAEELLREIEGESDPAKADELFKQSIEMLNELSEAKQIMSAEEFSKEMIKQEVKKLETIEPPITVDSLEGDVFETNDTITAVITTTNTPSSAPLTASTVKPTTKAVEDKKVTAAAVLGSNDSQSFEDVFDVEPKKEAAVSAETKNEASILPMDTTLASMSTLKPLTSTHIPQFKLISDSQSLEDAFEFPKPSPKLMFLKKSVKKPFLKPMVEDEPSKEILQAASSSNEARRAPTKYFEGPYPTLPPLDNFPSPPPSARARARPAELPRIPLESQEYRPHRIINFEEYDEIIHPTTAYPYFYKSYKKHTPPTHLIPNARGNFVDQPYVDELTRDSPFETNYDNRVFSSVRPQPTTTESPPSEPPTEATTEVAPVYETAPPIYRRLPSDSSPFDFPEIRRAPIPRRAQFEDFKKFDNLPVVVEKPIEKIVLEAITQLPEKISSEIPQEVSTSATHMDTKDGEGVKSYEPKTNKEMPIQKAEEVLVGNQEFKENEAPEYQNDQDEPELIPNQEVETLVPMNALTESSSIEANVTDVSVPKTTISQVPVEATTLPTETETPSPEPEYFVPADYQEEPEPVTYDPRAFYHTLPPRPITKKEKYLTFCTKDIAIRDMNNMIVACGSDNEVWVPKRCPEGTDCFYTTDSTFRICCPVAEG